MSLEVRASTDSSPPRGSTEGTIWAGCGSGLVEYQSDMFATMFKRRLSNHQSLYHQDLLVPLHVVSAALACVHSEPSDGKLGYSEGGPSAMPTSFGVSLVMIRPGEVGIPQGLEPKPWLLAKVVSDIETPDQATVSRHVGCLRSSEHSSANTARECLQRFCNKFKGRKREARTSIKVVCIRDEIRNF